MQSTSDAFMMRMLPVQFSYESVLRMMCTHGFISSVAEGDVSPVLRSGWIFSLCGLFCTSFLVSILRQGDLIFHSNVV